MQITVFGASGKVGREVVRLALKDGHIVRVFVHRHNPFENTTGVTSVQGSITDEAAVQSALQGSDAVICTLGSWGTKTKDIVSRGMKTILPAMESAGIRRIVTVTGAGAFWSQDDPGILDKMSHAFLGLIAPKILADGELHLTMLEASKLDWTCIRSPVMTPQKRDKYRLRLGLISPTASIPRGGVARCMIDQLTDSEFIAKAPVIVRK